MIVLSNVPADNVAIKLPVPVPMYAFMASLLAVHAGDRWHLLAIHDDHACCLRT